MITVKRDDGSELVLSWEECRRVGQEFLRAILRRDLERLGWV